MQQKNSFIKYLKSVELPDLKALKFSRANVSFSSNASKQVIKM